MCEEGSQRYRNVFPSQSATTLKTLKTMIICSTMVQQKLSVLAFMWMIFYRKKQQTNIVSDCLTSLQQLTSQLATVQNYLGTVEFFHCGNNHYPAWGTNVIKVCQGYGGILGLQGCLGRFESSDIHMNGRFKGFSAMAK